MTDPADLCRATNKGVPHNLGHTRDRDAVLRESIRLARECNMIIVLWQSSLQGSWHAARYRTVNNLPAPDNLIPESVRYILPNGEVTKLS